MQKCEDMLGAALAMLREKSGDFISLAHPIMGNNAGGQGAGYSRDSGVGSKSSVLTPSFGCGSESCERKIYSWGRS